ncbi:unnamed protein product [Rotaria magnacalcarata]
MTPQKRQEVWEHEHLNVLQGNPAPRGHGLPLGYTEWFEGPGNLQWMTGGVTIIGNGQGSSEVYLAFPGGLYLEPKTQHLYVADIQNNRVLKSLGYGEAVTVAGQSDGTGGSTADTLWSPVDVFADEYENVFVADWNNHRIQYWEKNATSGKTVAGNGTRGSTLHQFSYPSRVLVDSKKNIIVADTQNARIMKWPFKSDPKTSVGTIIAGGNGAGLNPYQLNNPSGLYLDEINQILYVTNEDSHSVTQWIIGDYENRNIYAGIPGRPGNSSAQLFYPQGVTMDPYGNLYVADVSNHRIQMFCPDAVFGITIAGTGQSGAADDQLSYPYDIAFDPGMNLYVSDTWNNRIQRFNRI